MSAPVEFHILGSVELWADGQRMNLGTAKERCLLAILLQTPGQAVSAEALVTRIWGEDSPPKARDSLYTYVSRLRARLQHISGEAWIASSRSGGYLLETDPETIDLHRFRRLHGQARAIADSGGDDQAAALYAEAARLWRGEPLADVPGDWALRTRANLEEELLATTLDRVELELRRGRHADLIGELTRLVERHPFNEKLVERLIVALYRCGRQADALQAYRDARDRLREELGAEANPELQELHQRVLSGDRTLLPVAPPVDPDPPDNLPHDTSSFTGRAAEIAELLDAAPATVIAVDGMPGIGKTVFAVHLAHRLADRYPDGRLYLNLHTYDADQPAVDAHTALDMLLRMIGVAAGRIPRALDDRAALWRAELARRRLLLLLDDAAGHDQIRPLLPGAPGSLTLVTSRRRLAGLDDVRSCSLDLLSPAEAATLFTRVVGADRATDTAAVTTVTRLCGFLPMAIQLVGNRLRHRSAWSTADLAGRLMQDHRRLAEIRAETREITVAFEMSYRELAPPQRQAFRRLGLHPGPDFTRHTAAAAIDGEPDRFLDDLLDHHLVTEPGDGRFRFHDLIRDYARHLADRDDPPADRDRTLHRILDHYLYNTDRADRLLYPRRHRLDRTADAPRDPVPLDTADQAREWLATEHENLLRAAARTPLLAHVLAAHLESAGHWERAAHLHTNAVAAWRETGDDVGTAHALADLTLVLFRSGRYAEALTHAAEALAAFRAIADPRGEADVLDQTGLIHWHQSRFAEATDRCREALRLRRSLNDKYGEARSLDHLAILLEYTGQYAEAAEHRHRALARYAEIDDPHGRQMALNNAGDLALRLGDVTTALTHYQQAAAVTPEMGRQHEAIWLTNMANVYRHTGRLQEALDQYRRALATHQQLGDRRSEIENLLGIGSTYQRIGRYSEAAIHHQKALAISREITERYEEAQSLRHMGDALLEAGRYRLALNNYRQARDIADEIAVPYELAKSLEGVGSVLLHTRGRTGARDSWLAALRIYERIGLPEADIVRSRLRDSGDATGS